MKLTKTFINKLVKNPVPVLKTLSENDVANIVQQANYAYHSTDKPLFTDDLYDVIKDYLEELNPEHPILKSVGSAVAEDKKVELPHYMGSLDKIKTDPKLIDKFTTTYKGTYAVSDKLDGNSALLYYKNNNLQLFSRGDGTYGQNISHMIPFIQNIPKLNGSNEYTVRGELIISKKDFAKVADRGANARNMVAGVINAKIPDLEIMQLVQFVAYELIYPRKSPSEQFDDMNKQGFKIAIYEIINESDMNIENLSKILIKRREDSEFEIDGIVIMHNYNHNRTKENPKYAFAFKSALLMSKAEVIVTEVEWNMSKDGYLIPVVNFNPITLAGASIKRAHGFNGKFIKDNKIGPGSRIEVIRSGDVIPYIEKVISPAGNGKGSMPDVDYIWSKTGVDIILANKEDSDEVRFKNIDYFFGKVDIPGLSTGNLRKIYDTDRKTVYDILNITKADLLKVPGFKDKMAEKLFTAINEKKDKIDCLLMMDASNVFGRGIGSKKLKLVIDTIPKIMRDYYVPNKSELLAIKGIEDKTAESIIDGIPKFKQFMIDNKLLCIKPSEDNKVSIESTKQSNKFEGQVFVFTGFRSKILEEYIQENGGTIGTTISKKTTSVIRKDNEESTKVDKAKELGINIINLSEFENKNNIKAK